MCECNTVPIFNCQFETFLLLHQFIFVVCIDCALAPLCLENRERRSVNYLRIGLGNEACAQTRTAALLGSVRVGSVWSELIGDVDRSNNRRLID